MITSAFNKRDGGQTARTIFGVEIDKLAELPHHLRGAIIDALVEAEAALTSNDERRQTEASTRIAGLLGDLQRWRADRDAEKAFTASASRTKGDHAVVRKFAQRAGVWA